MCFSDCDFVKTIMNMVVLHENIDEILPNEVHGLCNVLQNIDKQRIQIHE